MGFTVVKVQIASRADHTLWTELELLVDTGARYALLPKKILQELRITSADKARFKTADGRIIARELGKAVILLRGKRRTVPVIFGEETDAAVLGVTTLEIFDLEVSPLTGELRPSSQMFLI